MSFRCDLHIFPAFFPRFTPRIVHYSSSQNKKNLLENIMQIPIEQIKTASKKYMKTVPQNLQPIFMRKFCCCDFLKFVYLPHQFAD